MNPVRVARLTAPWCGGDRVEQPGRHDGPHHEAVGALAAGEEVVGEQHAGLVTGERDPAAAPRHHHPEAVGVGIVGDRQVGVHLLGPGGEGVERARLLRVGVGRPSGSRRRARTGPPTWWRGSNPAAAKARTGEVAARPRGGRCRRRPSGRGPGATGPRRVDVGPLDPLEAPAGRAYHRADGRFVRRVLRRRPRSATRSTAAAMRASSSAGDLGAVGQVHLVAVVRRRVVGGGDRHPGVGAEVADREGEQRGGHRAPAAAPPGVPRAPGPPPASAAKASER